MSDDGQEVTIGELRHRFWELKARKAALLSEMEALAGRIGEIRQALGNPFFYSGSTHARKENAEKSEAQFSGYDSHEAGLRLFEQLRVIRNEMRIIRKRLNEAGFDVD